MINILSVTKAYGAGAAEFKALDNVSVTIQENEFFTLLGPSGCGKTTLLRIIAGFVDPTEGQVILNGEDLRALPPYKRPVNTVFQNYALFPHMTVAENIGFGLKMLNQPAAQIKATVDDMLELVKMTPMAHRQVSEISGGQQQRVALARALAPRPQVLLLDEPLSALDYKLRKEMQLELKRLQAETGITFIFVTHDQEEALTMSDRILVMNQGSIRQIGSPREIYDHPTERFVADFIGETNFLDVELLALSDKTAQIRLPSGVTRQVQAAVSDMPLGKATLAVRPEHADLGPVDGATLTGVLKEIVYFGTDTHFHITLTHGGDFVLRRQNQPGRTNGHAVGDSLGIHIPDDVGQILKD